MRPRNAARSHSAARALAAASLASFATLGVLTAIAGAQAEPPFAPGPAERVLFAPHLGFGYDPGARDPSADGPIAALDDRFHGAGLTVQNGGDRPTRVLAFYFAERTTSEAEGAPVGMSPVASGTSGRAPVDQPPGRPLPEPDGCGDCGLFNAVCSPPVAPGHTWTFPPRRTADFAPHGYPTATLLASAVAFSLNHHPARDYGDAWLQEIERLGLPPGATVADVVCATQARFIRRDRAGEPDADRLECQAYRGFYRDYVAPAEQGGPSPVPGEPIAAVAAVVEPTTDVEPGVPAFERAGLDRYAAVTWDEAAGPITATGGTAPVVAASDVTRTYYLPNAYTTTPEGQTGLVFVQNAGAECAVVRLDAFRTGRSPVNAPVTLTVPAGGVHAFNPAAAWPDVFGPFTLQVRSRQPVAATATVLGYNTSATHTATRARPAPVAWAVPRAYQPPGPVPLNRRTAEAGASIDGPGAVDGTAADGTAAADGWETNVDVFNAGAEDNLVRMDTQAPGKPPRSASYPIPATTQIVLQLGLGLGLTGGGPGWGRLSSGDLPMAIALESFRLASDVPAQTEAWATAAWPYDPAWPEPGPRAVALPDLGGPATGGIDPSHVVSPTAAMTDTLAGRIAVQSLYTGTARIALDSFAPGCGYVGGPEWSIDRFQTLDISLADVPGTLWGADAAIVRVLEGEVAVLAEISRLGPTGIDGAPPDVTSAYLGVPLATAPGPPALAEARLAVAPDRFDIVGRPPGRIPVEIALGDDNATGRCLSYRASADMRWVTIENPVGSVPGTVRLVLDTRGFERPMEARVTIRVPEPAVAASPREVVIRVVPTAPGPPAIFLPALRNGEAIDR